MSDNKLPYDDAAEQSVLAACLLSSEVVAECTATLYPTDFFRKAHSTIFGEIVKMEAAGVSIDYISLLDCLRSDGLVEQAGGDAYIVELMGMTLSLANWQHHAEIVRRDAACRNVIAAANEIIALSYRVPDKTEEYVASVQELILKASEHAVPGNVKTYSELNPAYVEKRVAEARGLIKDEATVRTGFPNLDRIIGGFRPSELIVLGARPAVGKTAFAVNLALNAAMAGTSVLLFSLEMTYEQIADRFASIISGIPLQVVRGANGKMSEKQIPEFCDVNHGLSALPLFFDDTPDLTVPEMRIRAKRALHGCKKALIIIDYLQIINPPHGRRAENRNIEIGEMTRGLRLMARELGIPVVVLSQLSRGIESRSNKRPMLSDLRDSGSIEQDANTVMFLDRSTDEFEASRDDRPDENVTRVIVAKNRQGGTGYVDLRFDAENVRLVDLVKHKDGSMTVNG